MYNSLRAEIQAAHTASIRRRPAAVGVGRTVATAGAVHYVAAQLVAVRVASGPAAAHRVESGHVGDRRRQLRWRRGERGGGRQVGELQLGDAAERHEGFVVVLNTKEHV